MRCHTPPRLLRVLPLPTFHSREGCTRTAGTAAATTAKRNRRCGENCRERPERSRSCVLLCVHPAYPDTACRHVFAVGGPNTADMLQKRSNIQTDDDDGSQTGRSDPHALLYGAVCGVSTRRTNYSLPAVEEVTYHKGARPKRLQTNADVVRAPLGFLAPADPPGTPQRNSWSPFGCHREGH
jgi:hypothetical protein